MKQWAIGLALDNSIGCSVEEAFPLLQKYGFDTTFTMVEDHHTLSRYAELAQKHGVAFSSLHAPFHRAAAMWTNTPKGDRAEQTLHDSIDACEIVKAPTLVIHPFIGFYEHTPTEIGLARYRRLAEHATQKAVPFGVRKRRGRGGAALSDGRPAWV